ncbi:MAG: methyltransferase domain-containing protein [Candidatus Cloacimonadales bacterium]|nr:methyltransferase domain-containing protein [Candidatus Cloacimonadales bacterium]
MAIPILKNWQNYFQNRDEGLGSSYERIILNRKLAQTCDLFEVKKVLECPSFGFTGLSGINSMDMARKGVSVEIMDNNQDRIKQTEAVWKEIGLPLKTHFTEDFSTKDFADDSFDLTWNFSALWFVNDLDNFLTEIGRVTRKVIFLCVPNRAGIGYISQKFLGKEDLKKYLKEENILPKNLKRIMKKLNWTFLKSDYIDCPPWPDIGMPKEKFLKIFGLGWLLPKQTEPIQLSIMDYYSDKNPEFENEMLKHSWFEKKAPNFIKRFWAHHRYFLFIPSKNEK